MPIHVDFDPKVDQIDFALYTLLTENNDGCHSLLQIQTAPQSYPRRKRSSLAVDFNIFIQVFKFCCLGVLATQQNVNTEEKRCKIHEEEEVSRQPTLARTFEAIK